MMLAKDALRNGAKSLDLLADELGFQSASAFSTAFRKRTGFAPGGFARSQRRELADSTVADTTDDDVSEATAIV
jgi:AraC-like DNA-binding protein